MLALYDVCNAKFLISTLLGAYITYYFFAVRSVPLIFNLPSRFTSLPCCMVTLESSWISFALMSLFWMKYTHLLYLALLVECRRCWDLYLIAPKRATMRSETLILCLICGREVISFLDGGEMTISWSKIEGTSDDTPIVVLFPGLNSCACSAYIISIVKAINHCKYR